eukprot:GHVP01071198.1.p1 GENE.GHVP01071198.1~~GHVP01071198.1.p1  ORF type:complete len:140 (+),score=37.67 GHVP01071198.1:124-543(+)
MHKNSKTKEAESPHPNSLCKIFGALDLSAQQQYLDAEQEWKKKRQALQTVQENLIVLQRYFEQAKNELEEGLVHEFYSTFSRIEEDLKKQQVQEQVYSSKEHPSLLNQRLDDLEERIEQGRQEERRRLEESDMDFSPSA